MAAEAQVERTYGNWRRPRPPGLWHLGLISSVLFIVGSDRGDRRDRARRAAPRPGVAGGHVAGVLVTLRPDPHGQTAMQRIGMRLGWRRARRARSHLYRSGPLGRVPYGTFQLPGLLGLEPAVGGARFLRPAVRGPVPPVDPAPHGRARDRARRGGAGRSAAGRSVGRALRPVDRRALPGARAGRLPGVGRDRSGSGDAAAACHPGAAGPERADARARDAAARSSGSTRPERPI